MVPISLSSARDRPAPSGSAEGDCICRALAGEYATVDFMGMSCTCVTPFIDAPNCAHATWNVHVRRQHVGTLPRGIAPSMHHSLHRPHNVSACLFRGGGWIAPVLLPHFL